MGVGSSSTPELSAAEFRQLFRKRLCFNFGLFFIFFCFYLWVAIVNTPTFQDFAAIPICGMPLGMFTSLLIFPFSFVLITIYFIFWR